MFLNYGCLCSDTNVNYFICENGGMASWRECSHNVEGGGYGDKQINYIDFINECFRGRPVLQRKCTSFDLLNKLFVSILDVTSGSNVLL